MTSRYSAKTPITGQVQDWGRRRNRPMGFPFPLHNVNTSVTTGAVAHTKTAWTEVIASTDQDSNLICFDSINRVNAAETSFLVDYAIGPAGSEVVIAENVYVGQSSGSAARFIPVFIPIGSRVAIRVQSNRTTSTNVYGTQLFRGDVLNVSSSVDTIGADTSNSRCKIIAVNSTWEELIASTAKEYRALILFPAVISATMAGLLSQIYLGTGTAGNETVIAKVVATSQTGEHYSTGFSSIGSNTAGTASTAISFYNQTVAAGTRLSLFTDANGGQAAAFVIGIPA